jgi:hypothetical protein
MRSLERVVIFVLVVALVVPALPARAGGIITETYYYSDCAAQNDVGYEWGDHDGAYYSSGTLYGAWKEVIRTDPETNSILSHRYYVWCSGAPGSWWQQSSLGGFCCSI